MLVCVLALELTWSVLVSLMTLLMMISISVKITQQLSVEWEISGYIFYLSLCVYVNKCPVIYKRKRGMGSRE